MNSLKDMQAEDSESESLETLCIWKFALVCPKQYETNCSHYLNADAQIPEAEILRRYNALKKEIISSYSH